MIALLSPAVAVAAGCFLSVLAATGTVWALTHERAHAPTPTKLPSAVLAPASTTPMVRTLGTLAAPYDLVERETQHDLLVQAGYDSNAALPLYYATRTLLALALPFPAWLLFRPHHLALSLMVVVLAAGVGYYAPSWFVAMRRRARQERIRAAVPNMIDMLVTCVDAGLGIDVALRHVAQEIGVASVELADELHVLNVQLASGVSRLDSLRTLERRTGVNELSALVNVLGVVERFGSGIAQSLRAHAQLTRRRRALNAETKAARASPALTVVMVIFILPALFVVLLGPAAVHLSHMFFPHAAGGL
jgi:tight adherence protein C